MPRTMSQDEHKQFNKYVKEKSKEFKESNNAISFLKDVGFCVENKRIVSLYDAKEE